ncbi:hypothetical protein QBC36DRAFT_140769 [Triangularia setosa]|uniref:Uncharacterized protein n=1 Tax=Triangularia setosa TaxID=2587417 RepID=A0AAN7A8F8_9PEZI|nr:hypothetical protein QBC36DRAFT_140769 [Podospora setosa]
MGRNRPPQVHDLGLYLSLMLHCLWASALFLSWPVVFLSLDPFDDIHRHPGVDMRSTTRILQEDAQNNGAEMADSKSAGRCAA